MNNLEAFFSLNYLPMKVSLVSMGQAELPAFLGSALRGVIGQTLHQNLDAYNYLYNNRTPNGDKYDIVNPYIILPPEMAENIYHKGEELSFHIILLGEAFQYIRPLINALQGIGRLGLGASRYPFELMKVTHSLDQRIIWKDGCFNDAAVRSVGLKYHSLSGVSQVNIRMLTPLRIRRKGKILDKLDFPTIIRNITRRIEMITENYGGSVDADEAERIRILSEKVSIIHEALEMKYVGRYSNRIGEKMDFSGLIGSVWFEGEITPFVPWLYAAQVLNIGRNTTFGMGRVQMEFI